MNDVLDLVVSAHGDPERWKTIRSVDVAMALTKGHPYFVDRRTTLHLERAARLISHTYH